MNVFIVLACNIIYYVRTYVNHCYGTPLDLFFNNVWVSVLLWFYIYPEADMPSLPVFPVGYRFFTSSIGLPVGRTFLPVFAIFGKTFYFLFYR